MLRINEIPNSSAAKSYFAKSDYYIEGEDLSAHWHGLAAEKLGLSGPVLKADFDSLCDNEHPLTGEKLTKARGERRVGYDFTFSIPKSVSVLYALGEDDRLPDVFREAVAGTMAEVERDMMTRVRRRGADHDRHTGNMAWCDFLHHTSRPIGGYPDPQLHIHAVAFSLTWDSEEQQWKAGQFGDLKKDGPYFQAMFRARLANKLQDLGYKLKVSKGDFEVVGVPDRVRKEFSRRTDLIEKMADALGITRPETKAKLGATTREFKREGQSWDSLVSHWESRLQEPELEAINDTVANSKNAPTRIEEQRNASSLDYALAHLTERRSVVDQRQVMTEALKFGLGHVSPEGIVRELARPGLIRRDIDGRTMLSTQGVLSEEKRLLKFAREGRGKCRPLGGKAWLRAGRDSGSNDLLNTGMPETQRVASLAWPVGLLSPPPQPQADPTIASALLQQDREPLDAERGRTSRPLSAPHRGGSNTATPASFDQQERGRKGPLSIHKLENPDELLHNRLHQTGSTLSDAAISARVGSADNNATPASFDQAHRGDHIEHPLEMVLSPSQQAASDHILTSPDRLMVVRGVAGAGKSTLLQSVLPKVQVPWVVLAPSVSASRGELRDSGFEGAETLAKFLGSKEMQQSVRNGLIVLDETGQAGIKDVVRLTELAAQLNSRILLLGDRKQHKSVTRGDVLAMLEDRAGLPVVEVGEIKRQAGQYKRAVELLAGGYASEGFDALDRLGWVSETNDARTALASDYIDALKRGQSALVVSPTHAVGNQITAEIRERLRAEGKLGEDHEFSQLVPLHYTEAQLAEAKKNPEPDIVLTRYGAYKPETIRLAEGDSIKLTAGGKTKDGHKLNNGSVYQVVGFTEEGDIRLNNGWLLGKDFSHMSHGYVATSFGSQGRTVDKVLVDMTAANFPAVGKEQFYVSVSRGRLQATVYTDSVEQLKKVIEREDRRLLASDLVQRPKRGIRKRLQKHLAFLNRAATLAREFVMGKEPELTFERD